jgi:hypothetical protein
MHAYLMYLSQDHWTSVVDRGQYLLRRVHQSRRLDGFAMDQRSGRAVCYFAFPCVLAAEGRSDFSVRLCVCVCVCVCVRERERVCVHV